VSVGLGLRVHAQQFEDLRSRLERVGVARVLAHGIVQQIERVVQLPAGDEAPRHGDPFSG
jgi:hypothetical protein